MNLLKLKKIIAVTTIASSLMMTAGPALAITAAELQAQIDALMAQLSTLQSQLAELEGEEPTVSGCTITSFDRALSVGMSGDDVKCLQIVLNSAADTQLAESGVGSSGNETNYFGPLTKAAVIKFQEKYAEDILASWGLTTGTGYVGSTTRAKLDSMLADGDVVTPPDAPTANVVSLAADTPVGGVVARGAQNVEFMKLKFTAGSEAYTVTAMSVTRSGVSADSDLSNVKLYDGTTQVGSSQAVGSVTHKAAFTNLSWMVPANSTKYLTVTGSILSTAAVSNSIILGIASVSDITSTATLGGTFPMNGGARTVATQAVGTLTVDMLATPAASQPISGSVQQHVGTLQLTAATEAFDINSIKFTQIGTAGDADVSNVMVKYGATLLGTMADITAASVTLTGSPIINIPIGSSKNLDIYVDVAAGIRTSRTVRWEITQAADVVAVGSQSGGAVIPLAAASFAEQGAIHTISQGALTTALDAATNPSAQNYVVGTAGNKMVALKFSAGSTEGVRITQVILTLTGSSTVTDISNISLYDGDTLVGGPSGISGTTVQFGVNTINTFDTAGLFDIPASSNKVIMVKADVPSGAHANDTIGLKVNAVGDVKSDGLSSEMDLPAGTGTPAGQNHTITDRGSLAVSLAATSPAAQTTAKGTDGKEVARYNLTAGAGEDVIVSTLILRIWKDGTGDGTAAVVGDLTNVSLWDGATQLGVTVAAPIATPSFSANLTVPAGTTKIVTVKADIPTGTTAASVHLDLEAGTAGDMISTGASSLATITETGDAEGNLMTIGTPSVAVVAGASPIAASKVLNTTDVTIANLLLTAGVAEGVKVSAVKVTFAATNTLGTATASVASAQFSNVRLMEGTTQYGITRQVTDGGALLVDYVQFTGIENLTVPAGQTKQVSVVVNITGSSAGPWYAGHAANADIVGSGVSSGGSATSTGGVQSSAALTIASSGALAVSVDAGTPVSANVAVGLVGTTDVAFSKIKFTPTIESVKLSRIMLTRSGGADANLAAVHLYDGATKLGTSYPSSGAVTFNFSAGNEIIVPFGGEKVITAKADLTGVGTGVTHADAPILYVASTTADIDSTGADSQQPIVESGTDVMTAANFGAMALYKTTASIALNSSSPSGAKVAGATQELLRVDITNNGLYDLTVISFDVTPLYSGTATGTTDTRLYWSTDMATIVATSSAFSVGGSGSQLTITLASNNTVGAGSTRTLVVTGDTVGLVNPNAFHLDLSAVADFGWNPAAGGEVTTLTAGMPLTGGTITY